MTEWISGVNIPSCQLMIGMGVPLHRIPDIRRLFGKDPKGTGPIDFEADAQIPPSGMCAHCPIAGRSLICTEAFLPLAQCPPKDAHCNAPHVAGC